MKRWKSRTGPPADQSAAQAAGALAAPDDAKGWTFGAADLGIAAGLLSLTLSICFPAALYLRKEARAVEVQQQTSLQRSRAMKAELAHLDLRRAAQAQLRRELIHYVADVEGKPMVPWSTAVGELSRRRPHGVWTTRISGNGPHFRAQVSAERPELVGVYTQSLRQSPYLDFAALPAGTVPSTHTQVVGRLTGE